MKGKTTHFSRKLLRLSEIIGFPSVAPGLGCWLAGSFRLILGDLGGSRFDQIPASTIRFGLPEVGKLRTT